MEDNKSTTVKKMVKSGITFGSALAMVISYKNLMVSGTNVCWIRNSFRNGWKKRKVS